MLWQLMSNRVKLADISPQPKQSGDQVASRDARAAIALGRINLGNFECLCVRLVKKDPDAEFAQAYGVKGQNQEGIDLYVRKRFKPTLRRLAMQAVSGIQQSGCCKGSSKVLKAFRTDEAGIPIKEGRCFGSRSNRRSFGHKYRKGDRAAEQAPETVVQHFTRALRYSRPFR